MKTNSITKRLIQNLKKIPGITSVRSALSLFIAVALISGLSAQTIVSYQVKLAGLSPEEAQHLQSLVTSLNPSVILSQGQVTQYGNGAPIVAECDPTSVNLLYENNPLFNGVQLIRIKVNSASGLPAPLDLSQLQSFNHLQYVLMVFTYDACGNDSDACLATLTGNLFLQQKSMSPTQMKSSGPQAVVLYQLSIPE